MPEDQERLQRLWQNIMANQAPPPPRKMKWRVNEPAPAPRAEPMVPPNLNWLLDDAIPVNPFAAAAQPIVAEAKPEAPKVDVLPFTERSTRLPRFKMNYENQEEIQLRLNNTIAMVYDEYVYIAGVGTYRCDRTGVRGNGIMCAHANGKNSHYVFATEGLDLRSPPVGYVKIDATVYYLTRPPVRVYKQGINRENTTWVRAWDCSRSDVWGNHNIRAILTGLNDRPVISWSPELMEDVRAVRLSDSVAVRRKAGGKFEVMYKNKPLGMIVKDKVVLVKEPTDWCRRSLEAVGLL